MLLLLIRHAHTDAVGVRLAGRAPGHELNATGRAEAERLGRRLAAVPLTAIYSGPLARAQQTAAAIAKPHGLAVRTLPALDELDFGEWTGRTFEELAADPRWRTWNEARGSAGTPGGETMLEVQRRVVEGLSRLVQSHAGETIAAVSHADVVRAALAFWLRMPLDDLLKLEIAPASASSVTFEGGVPRVILGQ
jgi:ribonuclease H / adenosylcobalamin/alpha-ribazole phosphatase